MLKGKSFSLLALLCLPLYAGGQTTIPQEYDKLIQQRSEVIVFGVEGFGDKVDISRGGLEIVQTDVDLPGSNKLPVRVARRFVPGNKYALGHFGVWNLDIPYAHGVFGYHAYNPQGWTVNEVPADIYKRCSHYGPPLTLVFQAGVFEPDEYWHGNFLHMPDSGDEELLSAPGHVPIDGSTYPIVTKSGAAVRCVALAPTSEPGSQGEGFEVVAADGTVYTLNQMVSRVEEHISKPIGQMALRSGSAKSMVAVENQTMAATSFGLNRREVLLYPTRIRDSFGNTVTYSWSVTNPWQLLSISASDGRQIIFTYASSTSSQVTSVSDGNRTWTYSGTADAYTVTQPDGSKWISNLLGLFEFKLHPTGDGCFNSPNYVGGIPAPVIGTITAPSGAMATFLMQPVKMGRSWVAPDCVFNGSEPIYAWMPAEYFTLALVGKTVVGPGMPLSGLSWNYSYGAVNSCWVHNGSPLCSASSPTTRTVSVTDPTGQVVRYSFGNVAFGNDGLLQKTEYGWSGSAAQRTEDVVYADSSAPPYASFYGGTPRARGDTRLSSEQVPLRRRVITQQGRTFTWEVAADCSGIPYCFDAFARPTKIIQSSSP